MTQDEIYNQALKDLNMSEVDFQDYVKNLGMNRIKWAKILFDEQLISEEMSEKLRQLHHEKQNYYLYECDEKIDKKNLEEYIQSDPTYNSCLKIYNNQKNKEKFITEILATLDRQSFGCNNLLKHMIWQSGASA